MKQEFYVVSFASTHYAMMTEKKLKEKFSVEIIPTPRSITASCGLSLKFGKGLYRDIMNEIATWGLDPALFEVYLIEKTESGDRVTRA